MAKRRKWRAWGGVAVERDRRDAWADEVERVLRSEAQPFFFVASGQAMVIGLRYADGSMDVFDVRVRRHRGKGKSSC